EDCMCCTPGFHTSFRHFESLRDVVQILERVFHIHDLRHSVSDSLFKICLILFLDDKDDLFKSCPLCIKNREIHNDMSFFVHRVDLLQSAVPASHTCRHNHQNRFLHLSSPSCFLHKI